MYMFILYRRRIFWKEILCEFEVFIGYWSWQIFDNGKYCIFFQLFFFNVNLWKAVWLYESNWKLSIQHIQYFGLLLWHIFASEKYLKICEKRNSIWEDNMQKWWSWSWGEGYPGYKSGVDIFDIHTNTQRAFWTKFPQKRKCQELQFFSFFYI